VNFTDLPWWTAERVSSASNAGVLVAALVTAVIALLAIFQTKRIIEQNEKARTEHSQASLDSQNKQEEYNRIASESAAHQARSVELQREAVERANRPMMTVRYLPPQNERSVLELEISNAGRSVAYEVRVTFEPDLPARHLDVLNENSHPNLTFHKPNIDLPRTVFVGRIFQTWVPGQCVTAPFWVQHMDYQVGDRASLSAEGIPANQLVRISYRGENHVRYSDTFELDPGIWAAMLFYETDVKKQRKALEKIAKAVEKR